MSPALSRSLHLLKIPLFAAALIALGYGIWAAVTDDAGPNRLIVPLKVDHIAKVELFYDQGAGLRAEDSVVLDAGPSDELVELVFPVPRVPISEIRFHPMPDTGQFTIGQPRLESASGRFIAKFPITAIIPFKQIAEMHLEGKRWVGTTVPAATDPQLTFELGAPLRVGNPRVPWIEAAVTLALGVVVWKTRRSAQPASKAKTEA